MVNCKTHSVSRGRWQLALKTCRLKRQTGVGRRCLAERELNTDMRFGIKGGLRPALFAFGGVDMAKLDKMVGFVLTSNPEAAKEFYGSKLGFTFLRDDGFALVFDANGVMLRVSKMKT